MAPTLPARASELNPAAQTTPPDDKQSLAEKRVARWLVRQSQAGAATAAQVAMQEVEHGMRVTATVGALDPRDRVRLRDQIAALLARHGLVARDVQIVGAPRVSRDQRRGE